MQIHNVKETQQVIQIQKEKLKEMQKMMQTKKKVKETEGEVERDA